ncbi:MAG: HigA family addiction module antitoxin [Chloroflexi bacterium]|nr:HigA family addiction module antitoxin [Chloroflexota bacterium]
MKTETSRVYSDMPIPPGEVLEEEIEARGMTQKELAARLGKPAQAVNEIIKGKKAITPDTAIGLGKVLGISPHFWSTLEADYRMTLARNREREAIAANVQWLDEYPIREMIRRGWIQAGRDKESKLEALLSFLGVADAKPQVYQEAVGFRITEAGQQNISMGALAAWLRKGELEAEEVQTAAYDEDAFRQALVAIRSMTEDPPEEFDPAMRALCAGAGVAFCVVQELPKSGANGATRWLSQQKALIQMSLRNKWADIFWFSFFHEACHLLNHRSLRRVVIDGLNSDPDMAEIESEADRFARDFIIPPRQWSEFCNAGLFTPNPVREFAQSVGVAPFIVVGRLQKEDLIGYSQLTSLKRRYEWVADSNS